MTEVQIKACERIKAELLRQTREKDRDLFYLKKPGRSEKIV